MSRLNSGKSLGNGDSSGALDGPGVAGGVAESQECEETTIVTSSTPVVVEQGNVERKSSPMEVVPEADDGAAELVTDVDENRPGGESLADDSAAEIVTDGLADCVGFDAERVVEEIIEAEVRASVTKAEREAARDAADAEGPAVEKEVLADLVSSSRLSVTPSPESRYNLCDCFTECGSATRGVLSQPGFAEISTASKLIVL